MTTRSPLWLILLLAPLSVQAQDYSDLDPTRWFPLELGNYWYYEYEQAPVLVREVRTTDRDTLIDGQRWTAWRTIYCNVEFGTSCAIGQRDWFQFTDDFYLLRASIGPGGPDRITERADTTIATSPTSIFATAAPLDTLELWWRPDEPLIVELREDARGIAADTTNLELVVYPTFLMGPARYTYNVGPSGSLVGALVGGREWGDVSELRRLIALPNEEPEALSKARMEVYPNPVRDRFTVALTLPSAEPVSFEVVNVLGQTVARYGPVWSTGGATHHAWTVPDTIVPGVYAMRVRASEQVYGTTKITVY
ncbi:MAG: T9SS type A sorting domain-containing protein [Bacteroidota bacterium]